MNNFSNLHPLNPLLLLARSSHYAVGSFSPRYVCLVKPVLEAVQALNSPAIVQISQKELDRFLITPDEFSKEFYLQMKKLGITVPVCLHLDHTKDFGVIKAAIAAGFTSVMIDASEKPFDENVRLTKEVVEYAHPLGVSVEAELGQIGTTDFVETDRDEEHFTDPEEAKQFVALTGVDALAVSVGTAHGLYTIRKPRVDTARLSEIGDLTDVFLVLHGGSGVPSQMVKDSYQLPVGTITKVNIATDLEQAFLKALGKEKSMLNRDTTVLSSEQLETGRLAVKETVMDKISHYLDSENKAK